MGAGNTVCNVTVLCSNVLLEEVSSIQIALRVSSPTLDHMTSAPTIAIATCTDLA